MRVVLIFVLIFFNGMRPQESARIYRVKKFQKTKRNALFQAKQDVSSLKYDGTPGAIRTHGL